MKILIVGGGKVTHFLIPMLQRANFEITVVDRELEACERIADTYAIDVYHGDGTDAAVLNRAHCGEQDMVLALTGQDENNLTCCQLAKHAFGVPATIANVNNPRNTETMARLGVDELFSGTQLLADILEDEIEFRGLRTAYKIPGSHRAIVEFVLHPASDAVGQDLSHYDFPEKMLVVLITRRDGEVVTPTGRTVMQARDTMLLLCDRKQYATVWERFVAPNGTDASQATDPEPGDPAPEGSRS